MLALGSAKLEYHPALLASCLPSVLREMKTDRGKVEKNEREPRELLEFHREEDGRVFLSQGRKTNLAVIPFDRLCLILKRKL